MNLLIIKKFNIKEVEIKAAKKLIEESLFIQMDLHDSLYRGEYFSFDCNLFSLSLIDDNYVEPGYENENTVSDIKSLSASLSSNRGKKVDRLQVISDISDKLLNIGFVEIESSLFESFS